MVQSKLFVGVASPIGVSPSLSRNLAAARTSGLDRACLLFLLHRGLNGLTRALPVGWRQFRQPREGAGRGQMMTTINGDRIAGDVVATVRHQEDQKIAQLVH